MPYIRKTIERFSVAALPLLMAFPLSSNADQTVVTETVVRHHAVTPGVIKEVDTYVVPSVFAPDSAITTTEQTSEIIIAPKRTSVSILKPAGIPDFKLRLMRMSEQVDLGLSNGWLTASRADSLKERARNLLADTSLLNDQDFANGKADRIEREANMLNIDIADSMKNAPSISSTSKRTE